MICINYVSFSIISSGTSDSTKFKLKTGKIGLKPEYVQIAEPRHNICILNKHRQRIAHIKNEAVNLASAIKLIIFPIRYCSSSIHQHYVYV